MKTYLFLAVLWAVSVPYDLYWSVHFFTTGVIGWGLLEAGLALLSLLLVWWAVRRYRAERRRRYRVVRVTVPREWLEK